MNIFQTIFLGKNKAMRPGDLVCVAYSGGTASTSLVHLLKVSMRDLQPYTACFVG